MTCNCLGGRGWSLRKPRRRPTGASKTQPRPLCRFGGPARKLSVFSIRSLDMADNGLYNCVSDREKKRLACQENWGGKVSFLYRYFPKAKLLWPDSGEHEKRYSCGRRCAFATGATEVALPDRRVRFLASHEGRGLARVAHDRIAGSTIVTNDLGRTAMKAQQQKRRAAPGGTVTIAP